MYIFCFYLNNRLHEVSCEVNSMMGLVTLFESRKIQFSVSDRNGRIYPQNLGLGPFKCWLKRDESFKPTNREQDEVEEIADYTLSGQSHLDAWVAVVNAVEQVAPGLLLKKEASPIDNVVGWILKHGTCGYDSLEV